MYRFCLIFLLSVLALASCVNKQKALQKTDTQKETVIEKKIFYRDTVFVTKPSETSLALPLNSLKKCPDNGAAPTAQLDAAPAEEKPKIYSQKNGNATVKVSVIHDTIKVTAECDSIAVAAQIRQEYESNSQTQISNSEKAESKKTGTGIFGGIAWVLGALVVGFILGKFIRIGI